MDRHYFKLDRAHKIYLAGRIHYGNLIAKCAVRAVTGWDNELDKWELVPASAPSSLTKIEQFSSREELELNLAVRGFRVGCVHIESYSTRGAYPETGKVRWYRTFASKPASGLRIKFEPDGEWRWRVLCEDGTEVFHADDSTVLETRLADAGYKMGHILPAVTADSAYFAVEEMT